MRFFRVSAWTTAHSVLYPQKDRASHPAGIRGLARRSVLSGALPNRPAVRTSYPRPIASRPGYLILESTPVALIPLRSSDRSRSEGTSRGFRLSDSADNFAVFLYLIRVTAMSMDERTCSGVLELHPERLRLPARSRAEIQGRRQRRLCRFSLALQVPLRQGVRLTGRFRAAGPRRRAAAGRVDRDRGARARALPRAPRLRRPDRHRSPRADPPGDRPRAARRCGSWTCSPRSARASAV